MKRDVIRALRWAYTAVLANILTSACTIQVASTPSISAPPPSVRASSTSAPAASQAPASSAAETTVTPAPTCAVDDGPFTPGAMVLERLDTEVPVLSMPLTAEGHFPVPPYDSAVDPRWSAAWWQDGAAPGSGEGTVHFDVHTYTDHGAIGNALGTQAETGDVIRLLDRDGTVRACYEVTSVDTWPVELVPTVDLSRSDGPARLAIEFCWDTADDWNRRDSNGNRLWLLRRYVIAEQIP